MSYDSMIDEVMRKQAKVCADLRAEVERLRALDKEAKSAFAPWVHGPGIVGGILHLQEEVERLRAEANARAVEELRTLDTIWCLPPGVSHYCKHRIAELSKPAAKESEPSPQEKQRRSFAFGNTSIENPCITPEMVDAEAEKLAKESEPVKDEPVKCLSCGGQGYITTASGIAGMVGYSQYSCSRCGGTGKLHYVTMEQLKDGEPAKPEEPDWTVTLAARAHDACNYASVSIPRLFAMGIEAICNLGREVRRGGAK